jgi:UDP-N-acetylglucosamine--dolichyl-phosphate N-acetylglucosaminephosphotransferase
MIMVDMRLIVLFLLVFSVSYFSLNFWIKRAIVAGLVGKDIHKLHHPHVAEMGGLPVIFSFIVGAFAYLGMRVFLFGTHQFSESIFAIVLAVLIAATIGMVDDILGWKIGLRQWQKPVLTLLVAFPIMAVDAGVRIMSIPLIGQIDLGILYPLVVIPAVMVVGSNGTNMLAGFNGLEAGLAGILIATLGWLAFITGVSWVAALCLLLLICIAVFWVFFNRYPSVVFPGDTFTYASGAFVAAVVIFADLEKAFVILFIPFVIQFFLKARGKFQKESFAKLKEKGELTLRYDKLYGLEHVAVWFLSKLPLKVTERKVVWSLLLFQGIFAIVALYI